MPPSSASSFLSLHIDTPASSVSAPTASSPTTPPPFHLILTKTHIKQSLASLLHIECEGYVESVESHLLVGDYASSAMHTNHAPFSISTPNDLPSFATLLDCFATLLIANPYQHNTMHAILDSRESVHDGASASPMPHHDVKSYRGIITHIDYLGTKQDQLEGEARGYTPMQEQVPQIQQMGEQAETYHNGYTQSPAHTFPTAIDHGTHHLHATTPN